MKSKVKTVFTGLLFVVFTTFSSNVQADCQSKLQAVLDQDMTKVEGLASSLGT